MPGQLAISWRRVATVEHCIVFKRRYATRLSWVIDPALKRRAKFILSLRDDD
jgi:hypothetical protein